MTPISLRNQRVILQPSDYCFTWPNNIKLLYSSEFMSTRKMFNNSSFTEWN